MQFNVYIIFRKEIVLFYTWSYFIWNTFCRLTYDQKLSSVLQMFDSKTLLSLQRSEQSNLNVILHGDWL